MDLADFPGDNSDPAFGGGPYARPKCCARSHSTSTRTESRDRTVLTRNDDESSYVDLTIYLGDDTDKSDLSRQPPSQNGIWRAPCL
jgi:hypothetical protein